MKNKTDFRNYAKDKRKLLNIEMISNIICEKIKKTKIFYSSKNIMIFYPLKYEINLLSLLENDDKNFFLPKMTEDKNLDCCPYKKEDKLEKVSFNVYEPSTIPIDKNILDLIILPALCVDKYKNRLGYGAGFYDRFLENISHKTKTLVAIEDEFVFDNIPTEDFDKKVDFIITEKSDIF